MITHVWTKIFHFAHDMEARNILQSADNSCNCILYLNILLYELNIAERFRFYKGNQQQGKRVADCEAELRRLAINCKFGNFLNEALCDRLVCGIRDEAAKRRLGFTFFTTVHDIMSLSYKRL